MLEKAHINAVQAQLKKLGLLHSQSMTYASLSMNGTPDRYYDGRVNDLWIEYKRLTAMPRSGIVVGNYSPQQLDWMKRRWLHSPTHNVWGAVGLPNRTICLQQVPGQWIDGTPVTAAITHAQLAQLIWDFCHGSTHPRQSKPAKVRRNRT